MCSSCQEFVINVHLCQKLSVSIYFLHMQLSVCLPLSFCFSFSVSFMLVVSECPRSTSVWSPVFDVFSEGRERDGGGDGGGESGL